MRTGNCVYPADHDIEQDRFSFRVDPARQKHATMLPVARHLLDKPVPAKT